MAQHKSSIKRIRSTSRRTARNVTKVSKLKTLTKKVRSLESKDLSAITLKEAIAYLDKMRRKGIIHRNKAANQKSRLTRLVNKLK